MLDLHHWNSLYVRLWAPDTPESRGNWPPVGKELVLYNPNTSTIFFFLFLQFCSVIIHFSFRFYSPTYKFYLVALKDRHIFLTRKLRWKWCTFSFSTNTDWKCCHFMFLKHNQQYKELWQEFNNINNRPLGPIMAKSVLDGSENLLNVHLTKTLAQMLL